jgi:hypothetical protein
MYGGGTRRVGLGSLGEAAKRRQQTIQNLATPQPAAGVDATLGGANGRENSPVQDMKEAMSAMAMQYREEQTKVSAQQVGEKSSKLDNAFTNKFETNRCTQATRPESFLFIVCV